MKKKSLTEEIAEFQEFLSNASMKKKPVKPDDLTDVFGFPVTQRTRTRAAQEGYDVVVVRGVAYYVDTQHHLAICE